MTRWQMLMARIDRLESRYADKLDQSMLQIHADLAAWYAYQGQADELRIGRVLAQLGACAGSAAAGSGRAR